MKPENLRRSTIHITICLLCIVQRLRFSGFLLYGYTPFHFSFTVPLTVLVWRKVLNWLFSHNGTILIAFKNRSERRFWITDRQKTCFSGFSDKSFLKLFPPNPKICLYSRNNDMTFFCYSSVDRIHMVDS